MVRSCDSYWRWREREVRRKLRELREREQERPVGGERILRHMMQPLREVWMMVRMEKVDTYEGVTVKTLLDSGATGMFADKKFVAKNSFKLEKLERLSRVTNVNSLHNSRRLIIHEIECNMYYKGHVERIRLDVCDLGRTEVILGMPWLVAHNPEIDWEKGEVRITRCPSMCGKRESDKERWCYAPSSISVYLGCRGHTCCPHVMLLFLVPVPGTFLFLSSSDIPLAIVPCNEVAPHCMPHGGPSPFYSLQP